MAIISPKFITGEVVFLIKEEITKKRSNHFWPIVKVRIKPIVPKLNFGSGGFMRKLIISLLRWMLWKGIWNRLTMNKQNPGYIIRLVSFTRKVVVQNLPFKVLKPPEIRSNFETTVRSWDCSQVSTGKPDRLKNSRNCSDRPEKMKPLNQKPVRLFNYNWLRFSFRKETAKN